MARTVLTRRAALRTAAVAAATGVAGCAALTDGSSGTGVTTDRGGGPPAVALRTVATGFAAPVDLAVSPDRPDRRYIVDQPGRIHVHDADGVRDEPFLDLTEQVATGGERGLLGLELHPNFGDDRRFYVHYSAPPRDGTPPDYDHTFVLASFRAAEDGLRAVPDSERTLLEIPEPQSNHNSGSITFGPDGFLYVGVGDGGGGGDVGTGHVDDWYDAVPGGNGQDVTENLLGSVLRIDVDVQEADKPYGIPDDNPLVGRAGLDEHYAWGFRNPWGMSFDGDDLFVADVGQRRYEEVNVVERGGNYGWNVKEGSHCYDADECPDADPDGNPLRDPIIEYPRRADDGPDGIAIIGGHVYRGSAIPALDGAYVFGDFRADGRLFVARRPAAAEARWPVDVIDVPDPSALDTLLAVGRDADGELYALVRGDDGGAVRALVPGD